MHKVKYKRTKVDSLLSCRFTMCEKQ